MQLSVLLVTDAMLFNSVTLRLGDMDQESFLSQPLYNYFVDGLAAIIPCPKENVFVFNIQVKKEKAPDPSENKKMVDDGHGRLISCHVSEENHFLSIIYKKKKAFLFFSSRAVGARPCRSSHSTIFHHFYQNWRQINQNRERGDDLLFG